MTTYNYNGYQITQRTGSHCATIWKDQDVFKMIVGDIDSDGSNNAILKAYDFINRLHA